MMVEPPTLDCPSEANAGRQKFLGCCGPASSGLCGCPLQTCVYVISILALVFGVLNFLTVLTMLFEYPQVDERFGTALVMFLGAIFFGVVECWLGAAAWKAASNLNKQATHLAKILFLVWMVPICVIIGLRAVFVATPGHRERVEQHMMAGNNLRKETNPNVERISFEQTAVNYVRVAVFARSVEFLFLVGLTAYVYWLLWSFGVRLSQKDYLTVISGGSLLSPPPGEEETASSSGGGGVMKWMMPSAAVRSFSQSANVEAQVQSDILASSSTQPLLSQAEKRHEDGRDNNNNTSIIPNHSVVSSAKSDDNDDPPLSLGRRHHATGAGNLVDSKQKKETANRDEGDTFKSAEEENDANFKSGGGEFRTAGNDSLDVYKAENEAEVQLLDLPLSPLNEEIP